MVRENSNNNYNKFLSPGGNITSGTGDEEMMTTRTNNDTNVNQKPAWLEGLMGETFFGGCGDHTGRRKNEKNVFCLLCCLSICPHCLPSHPSHPLLQVRRYVYQDVVRLGDLEKLVDCSYIQPYTINSAKVIFLHQRPQSRPCKGSANLCFTCDRILQEPFHFCSLSCKVNQMEYQGEDLSTILFRTDLSDFAFLQFEGLRMDSSEFIEDDGQTTSSSIVIEEPMLQQYRTGSSCSDEAMGSSVVSHDNEVYNEEKKKKKGSGFLPGINVLSLSNRRKGAPHRAPLS